MALKSLAHWNHRVIQHTDTDGSLYMAIHEVHYEDGKPQMYTEDPIDVLGPDLESLRWQLDHMSKALEAPILKESDFETPREGTENER